MNREQALVTSFAMFLVIMIGLIGWMLFGVSDAKAKWLASADVAATDLNARFVEEITVERVDTPTDLIETVTVNGVERNDCTAVRQPDGWNLVCDEVIALTPETAVIP